MKPKNCTAQKAHCIDCVIRRKTQHNGVELQLLGRYVDLHDGIVGVMNLYY